MPRFLSAVTIFSSPLPTVFTQTCRTFFWSGASQARRVPSGESRGEVLSGFPKRTSREMSGGCWAEAVAVGKAKAARIRAGSALQNRWVFIRFPPEGSLNSATCGLGPTRGSREPFRAGRVSQINVVGGEMFPEPVN